MSRAAVVAVLSVLPITACGPFGGAGGALGNRPLAYAHIEQPALIYAFADTTEFSIQAGPMGVMQVTSAESGLAELTFLREPGGGASAEALVRLTAFSGRFENPGQGAVTADLRDIRGVWRVRLSPRGRPTVVDTPSVSADARDLIGGESAVRPFFAHLPGRPAEPGLSWVDTVSVTERNGDALSTARSIVTATLVGDTLIGERRVALIHTRSQTTLEVEGASGGVEVLQRLAGTTTGRVLWDARRSVLIARSESGVLTGTLELAGSDFGGLPVEATIRRAVMLRP